MRGNMLRRKALAARHCLPWPFPANHLPGDLQEKVVSGFPLPLWERDTVRDE
jgi:hypothetical protein